MPPASCHSRSASGPPGAVLGLVALAVSLAGRRRAPDPTDEEAADPPGPGDRPRWRSPGRGLGGFLVALPVLPRPLGPVVAAHSQLVSSIPGAGEAVDTPPTELRLQFSESIAAGYTSFDLLDGTGKTLHPHGRPRRRDRRPPARRRAARPRVRTRTRSTGGPCPRRTGTSPKGAFTFAVTTGASASPGASAGPDRRAARPGHATRSTSATTRRRPPSRSRARCWPTAA